jgi:uncharacterized Fe-S cluster-containing radical SAM superfamily protein
LEANGVSLNQYDSVARHKAVEKLVTRNVGRIQEKKYWRFRFDRWYGGIVTADVVGCGLACKFCWVSDSVMFEPGKVGTFHNPENVVKILKEMANKRNLRQLRLSGGEPTLGKKHLLDVLESLNGEKLTFVLETNGILIGHEKGFAEEFAKYPFLHVRVSLKGSNEEEFGALTGAKPQGFRLQLKALENLANNGVRCNPAVMISFSQRESLQNLMKRIRGISRTLAREIETEELILYPSVQRKICKHGLRYYSAFTPKGVPKKLV